MQNKQFSVFEFLLGVFLGAAAGTLIGLLLAPRSGAESRHRLSEGIKDARGKTEKYVDSARHHSEDGLNQVKHLMEEKFSLLMDAVKAGKSAAERQLSSIESSNGKN